MPYGLSVQKEQTVSIESESDACWEIAQEAKDWSYVVNMVLAGLCAEATLSQEWELFQFNREEKLERQNVCTILFTF